MFDVPPQLRAPGTPWGIVWTYSHYPRKAIKGVTREDVLKFDFKTLCERFEESFPTPHRHEWELTEKFSLRLTANLLLGVVRLFDHRVTLVMDFAERAVERITSTEELSQDVVSEAEIRPLSPFDRDFDTNEEARANALDDDMTGPSRFEQLLEEHEEPPQQQAEANEEVPAPRRRTRKRTRKAVIDESDIDDEDVAPKQRTRRRRNVPAPNLARHEEITMREDHVGEVERDLDELEPLNEQLLSTADGHPVQLNDDTVLIVNPKKQASPVPFDDDFGFDAVEPPNQQVSLDRVEPFHPDDPISTAVLQSSDVQARLQSSGVQAHLSVHQNSTFGIPEQVRAGTFGNSRSFYGEQISTAIPLQSPERLPSGIQSILLGTPEQVRNRGSSIRSSLYPDNQIGDQISSILSPSMQARLRSISPSRIIAVTMMATPPRSVDPSVHGDSPVRGMFSTARSPSHPALPNAANSFDFDFDPPIPELSKRTKRDRPVRAKEVPIKLSNEALLCRDQLYLRKNHRDKRRLRAINQVADVKVYYQKLFKEPFVLEINDALRAMIENKALGREVHTPSQAARARSRTPMDFDNCYDGIAPLPKAAETLLSPPRARTRTPMDIDSPPRARTPMDIDSPPRARTRTPMDIDDCYDGIVPLPKAAENLLSPPRAFPLGLFRSSRSFKEIGCKYDHDHLYMLLLHRCVKEKKVLFGFDEFAKNWPRAFIAKQFHNFLLLIQMRKIVAHTRDDGLLQSFIILPNEEFKKNISKIATQLF